MLHWASEGEFYTGGFVLHNFIESVMFHVARGSHGTSLMYIYILFFHDSVTIDFIR